VDGKQAPRVLRCTQVYRIEDREWKIFHRHADELRPAARGARRLETSTEPAGGGG
jgi:hypothetical protein